MYLLIFHQGTFRVLLNYVFFFMKSLVKGVVATTVAQYCAALCGPDGDVLWLGGAETPDQAQHMDQLWCNDGDRYVAQYLDIYMSQK